jgi:D-xylose 1-dehydrogenase (NADP+, D-xylono-1,5-lactone-forming)
MAKVRWGVLGCANFAQRRTIPAMLESPTVDLVAVASRSKEKAESFRQQFNLRRAYGSYEDLLADPQIDAVYIPLPNGLHAEWAVKSFEQGKHCLCEKPFASNAAEAAQVARVASSKGLFAMEAFMWRLHSQHQRGMEAIISGQVGTVRLVRAAFTYPIPRKPNVRLVPELAGGSVMDVGCYPISAARYYFAAEPIRAFARGHIDPEYKVDMAMSGVLDFPAGRALIDCAFSLPYRTEVEIVGEAGRIFFPKPWLPDAEAVIEINGQQERLPPENQYIKQFEYFSNAILSGRAPLHGPEDAVLQMRVIDAVRRSMSSGSPEAV